jgi:hypothetical protein
MVKLLPALIAVMGIGAFLMILFVPYWIPTIIAFRRKHPNKGAIAAVNFVFGWTFWGWGVALVWALSDVTAQSLKPSVNVNTTVNAANTTSRPPAYQVGDMVNGHRFNGVSWVAVQPQPPVATDVGAALGTQVPVPSA